MAWLEQRGTSYHLAFRFAEQRFKKSLRTTDEREANVILERSNRRQRLIEQREVDILEDADLATFIISDGRRRKPATIKKRLSLSQLMKDFENQLPEGAMEATSLSTVLIHLNHIKRLMEPCFNVT